MWSDLKKSWTIYFNGISALLATAEMQFHLLKDVLPADKYGVALFALTMVNVALRVKTEIKHKKELAKHAGTVV